MLRLLVGVLMVAILLDEIEAQESVVKFVVVHDEGQQENIPQIEKLLKNNDVGNNFDVVVVKLEDEVKIFDRLCAAFSEGGTIIIDISWTGYELVKEVASNMKIPYLRIDLSISPFLNLLDVYLDARNSTDVALIFDNPLYVDQALYHWIDTTRLRMVITESLDETSAKRLRDMRPSPNTFALLTTPDKMKTIYKQVSTESLLSLPERWNLVFLGFDYSNYDLDLEPFVNIVYPDKKMCCNLINKDECECSSPLDFQNNMISFVLEEILKIVDKAIKDGRDLSPEIKCNDTKYDESLSQELTNNFRSALQNLPNVMMSEDVIRVKAMGRVEVVNENYKQELVATCDDGDKMTILNKEIVKPVKAFYRIGVTHAIPWSYQEIDKRTGQKYWTGYCLDFAHRLSELMNFDYEIVEPAQGTFGERDKFGNWNGVIGDLATGQTDIAITALTMTADKEEVVDFVAPYFEQVGISIVMRKPVRKTSLFKFMTVLKLEVWLSIVGALIVTGFMIWILDKYSPYSARNNKKAYPYACRHFNLKESFWFALTSFTPQGGGEAPKALSGRTLVAAYWLFVVLMLATFTANLAAFLTVERMQTPVQSLEQLARQSRINYTVIEGSDTHKYFINMKFAEDTLYRMWKELTLNASTDETQYRVWDYPIREQYGQILIAINDSMPVKDEAEGFWKVNEALDADFAFIHDSAEIKYEISRNCNLTEVGEIFAEKPYAIAVQQGSHLQDALSIQILDLQKDRFFEYLQAKYWNSSHKGYCANSDDNEGITLESLGGVFIATLFGLALAMITLVGEVFYYRRKKVVDDQKNITKKNAFNKTDLNKFPSSDGKETVTIGDKFKPVKDLENMRVSHIALYPRRGNRLPLVE